MIQCNSVNVKLSNSQLNKLKSVIQNTTEVTLKLSSNTMMKYDDEIMRPIFHNKLLLTDRQVSNLHKAFANNLSANIKHSNIQIGFLGRHYGTLV